MIVKVVRGNDAWRILVELAGRAKPVELRDLCETLGLEPTAATSILRDLWYDDRVEHNYNHPTGKWWTVTWQGEDALRRLDEAPKRRYWWTRRELT